MMSRLHVRLQVQFPYVKVLALGVLVSLLGIGEVIIGVLAFTHKIWGHYLGTGLWGGIVIFMAGVCAVIASQLRGPGCAKLYFATSVVGVLVSFVMLILSSGGLDYDSNFYNFEHFNPRKHLKRHNSTIMVHGVALGFSVCSFLANIASVIICLKYVVFEKKLKYTTERTCRKTTNSLERSMLRGGTIDSRSSTSSRTPLADRSPRRSSRGRRDSDQGGGRRRDSDHGGGRQRTEAEEFLPSSSRTDSSRRNKDRRHKRSEERKDRSSKGKRERNPVQQNEIPVSVQIERIAVHDEIEPNLICNDLLPTDFDEEELPPYEEAIRDTYSPVTNINNQVLVNNAHNESMRNQIDIGDINDEKIYQNVHYCTLDDCEISNESLPIIEAQGSVGRETGENSARIGNNRFVGNDNMDRNSSHDKAHTTAKYTQKGNQTEGNQNSDIYVNQDVIASNTQKVSTRGHQSGSPSSTLSDQTKRIQEHRRCTSAASSMSLPVGMAPPKPPRISSSSSDSRDSVETSKSDTNLNRKKPQLGYRSKPSLNDGYLSKNKQTVDVSKLSGPKLNVISNEGPKFGDNGRGKNSRYKADYIQLQIRQEPEGSSSVGGNEGTSTFIMTRPENAFGLNMAHSSPRESPFPKNDQKLPLIAGSSDEGNLLENPTSANKEEGRWSDSNSPRSRNTKQDHVSGPDGSPVSPNWDISGFSPVRFASPTSAFKPYKKESAPNSRVTSPDYADCRTSPDIDGAARPGNQTFQRQSSWKEIMLPDSHNQSNESDLSSRSSASKEVPMVKPTPKEVFMNTFPTPTPPIFKPPPFLRLGSTSSGTGTFNPGASSVGGFPSLFVHKPSDVVSTASNISPFEPSTKLTSSVSPNTGKRLSSDSSAKVSDEPRSSPCNRNVYSPSSGLSSVGRYNTLPHTALRPTNTSTSRTDTHRKSREVSDSAVLRETCTEDGQRGNSASALLDDQEGLACAARVSQSRVLDSSPSDVHEFKAVGGWKPTSQGQPPLQQHVENVQDLNLQDHQHQQGDQQQQQGRRQQQGHQQQQGYRQQQGHQQQQQGHQQQQQGHQQQQQGHQQQQRQQQDQEQGHQQQGRNEPQEQPIQPPLQQRQGKPLFSIIL